MTFTPSPWRRWCTAMSHLPVSVPVSTSRMRPCCRTCETRFRAPVSRPEYAISVKPKACVKTYAAWAALPTHSSMWSMPCSGMWSWRSGAAWGSSDSVLTAQPFDRFVGAGVEERADDGLDLVDGPGAVQDGLVVRDVVVDGAHLGDVQRAQLHVRELAELAVAREDPGAVGAQLAVLDDDAELQREPEH